MIVVADASVLIGLSSIGYLHLIQEQFSGKVLIPPAVWKEVVEQGGDRPGSHQVSKADWINVHDLKNQDISREIVESKLNEINDHYKAYLLFLSKKRSEMRSITSRDEWTKIMAGKKAYIPK